MTLQLSISAPKVTINNGKAVTTSQAVAEYFHKRHDNVVQKIKSLECSTEFTDLNFKVCFKNNELQNGKPQPYYEMTKDGFVFLVMGFTGKKAAAFKEAYIAEFNRMESELAKPVDYLTHPANPVRVLWTYYPNEAPVAHMLSDGELVASQATFIELARRAGWVCLPRDEFLTKFGLTN